MNHRIAAPLLTAMTLAAVAVVANAQTSTPAPAPAEAARPLPPGEYLWSPEWVRTPGAAEYQALYPQSARAAGLQGRVTATCTVDPEGKLIDCVINSETPRDVGFGAASMKTLAYFRVKPASDGGRPIAGKRVLLLLDWAPAPAGGNGLSFTVPIPLAPVRRSDTVPRTGVTPPPRPLILTGVQWERLPSGDEFAALYPAEARAKGVEGKTSMRCVVTKDGELTGCSVISETPGDLGFGKAALASARYFKMSPTINGQSVAGGVVIIPLTWALN